MQRRTVAGTQTQVEESYCGLAVVPTAGTNLKVWLEEVMASIVQSRGIMDKVLNRIDHQCGGNYARGQGRRCHSRTGDNHPGLAQLRIKRLPQGAPRAQPSGN